MKILVTGAAGFIGSSLTEKLLNQGHEIVGIDNFDTFYDRSIKESNLSTLLSHDKFKFVELNILDVDQLDEKFDVIIHLAAKAGVRPSIEIPIDYVETNIKGTNAILEYMVKHDIKKLVFGSSSSIYGNCKEIPFSETYSANEVISPYAFTKKSCELLNYTYHHLYNLDIVNLRFFTVYGPKQRPDLAIHKFTRLIFNDEPIVRFGEGDTGRDYTHVQDITDGIISSMNYVCDNDNVIESINIGNNYPIKLNELITKLFSIIGKEENIIQKPMQMGDVELTYADISKAKRLLGYEPKITIDEGLKDFVKWYREEKLTVKN